MGQIIKYIFFVIAVLEVISHLSFLPFGSFSIITKPMLMPVLALYFYYISKNTPLKQPRIILFIALFFAWLGDVFLMGAANNQQYFILGLVAFLIMQSLYIFLFKGFTFNSLLQSFWLVFTVLIYSIVVLIFLFPNLGSLKIPVLIYFSIILFMVLSSLDFSVSKANSKLVFYGAILFMVSDSIIAINKFQLEIDQAGFLIMTTYIAAQWLIVKGFTNYLNDFKQV
jgi:uncharacterized membrane protein YhhN